MRAPSPQPIIVGNLGGGSGAPQYVKTATFKNNSGSMVRVDVTFKSRGKSLYCLRDGESQKAEKNVYHGSSTSVDAVESFKVSDGVVQRRIMNGILGGMGVFLGEWVGLFLSQPLAHSPPPQEESFH